MVLGGERGVNSKENRESYGKIDVWLETDRQKEH